MFRRGRRIDKGALSHSRSDKEPDAHDQQEQVYEILEAKEWLLRHPVNEDEPVYKPREIVVPDPKTIGKRAIEFRLWDQR